MNIQLPENNLIQYVVHLADNNAILGHRLSEWCGHGPILEQDIALTNIALDLIGQARLYYQYAAELMGGETTEDMIAYLRPERNYFNFLLVERPNGDFGDTMVRQFLYDSFHYYFLSELQASNDTRLSEIAEKSIKEVAYHKRFSSEWVIRLGDGTDESNFRIQKAIDELWRFTEELFTPVTNESELIAAGLSPNPAKLKLDVIEFIAQVCTEAKINIPDVPYFQFGGKTGIHSEYLGHILAELQYMQRAYPGMTW